MMMDVVGTRAYYKKRSDTFNQLCPKLEKKNQLCPRSPWPQKCGSSTFALYCIFFCCFSACGNFCKGRQLLSKSAMAIRCTKRAVQWAYSIHNSHVGDRTFQWSSRKNFECATQRYGFLYSNKHNLLKVINKDVR